MKTLVLYYKTWPVRELESMMMDVHASFEAGGHIWHITHSPTVVSLYCAVHGTGYVLSGVLGATPEDTIASAKALLSRQNKEQIDAVLRAVKESTGAPLN